MKDRALALKKEITRGDDNYEYLNIDERARLKAAKEEYEALNAQLSEADREWVIENLRQWYASYMHFETVGSVRQPEG